MCICYVILFVAYIQCVTENIWETHHNSEEPPPRYGHSTILYGDKIFIYGGVVGSRGPTSELWAFDISAKIWENVTVGAVTCSGDYVDCGPLKIAGHSATVIIKENNQKGDRMVVIFGYSPYFGYLNTVQEYYFGTREWHIVNTTGYPVKGSYGHTASWDPYTSKIYVYGGDVSESQPAQILSKKIYSYDPYQQVWMLLSDAPSARFLHTATFVSPGLMLVFGGNTRNDTSQSFRTKCYSSELLAYDVKCDTWHVLSIPNGMKSDLSRYGHSAVLFEESLYIYGGFDGQMLSDILKFTPGNCSALRNQSSCLTIKIGRKCVWDTRFGVCESIDVIQESSLEDGIVGCPEFNRSYKTQTILQKKELCEKIHDCLSCVQTTSQCVWCGSENCTHETECSDTILAKSLDQCAYNPTPICNQLHTCKACSLQRFCLWIYYYPPKCIASLSSTITEATDQSQCQKVCSEYTSCLNCTQEECIWCQNEGRCIDRNAYISSFPYGQCREWTIVSNKCRSHGSEEKSQCSFYSTCTQCRDDPACGWCDDGSKTGLGNCMPGGSSGPSLHAQSLSSCLSNHWHFTTCPACQCNGHASCKDNTRICNGCKNLTMGNQCEKCIPGYWGSPVNGGKCQACECNGHATQCHPETGQCFCTTKGLVGDHCEKCDHTNHYTGDPSNKGSCYYDLIIDYQFTFNLSKKQDKYYTQINYSASPTKPNIDVQFAIICPVKAKMNVTMKTSNTTEEKSIFTGQNCTNFTHVFSKWEYNFGTKGNVPLTTFYVYVYGFQSPLWIQISFAQ